MDPRRRRNGYGEPRCCPKVRAKNIPSPGASRPARGGYQHGRVDPRRLSRPRRKQAPCSSAGMADRRRVRREQPQGCAERCGHYGWQLDRLNKCGTDQFRLGKLGTVANLKARGLR